MISTVMSRTWLQPDVLYWGIERGLESFATWTLLFYARREQLKMPIEVCQVVMLSSMPDVGMLTKIRHATPLHNVCTLPDYTAINLQSESVLLPLICQIVPIFLHSWPGKTQVILVQS